MRIKIAVPVKLSLFTSGRTGSQFVYDLFRYNFNGLELHEWLSPSFQREREDIDNIEFVTYLTNRILGDESDFAIKITPHIFYDFWGDAQEQLEQMLCATRATQQIMMYRVDFWSLCVSHWIGNKTGRWHSNQAQQGIREISFQQITSETYEAESRMFDLFLKHSSPNAILITYESLLSSPLTFSHNLLKQITSVNPNFASLLPSQPTKRVIEPNSDEYISLLQSIPVKELDSFYETKLVRDQSLLSKLSEYQKLLSTDKF